MAERAFDKVVEKGGHRFIQMKSGRLTSFLDNITAAEQAQTAMARHLSRAFKIAGEYDLDWLEQRVEDLETYGSALKNHLARLRQEEKTREQIAQLRNIAGRTPAEAESYLRKAAELER